MTSQFTLEAELRRRTETDKDADDFWHRYEAMKHYLAAEYYPWIQATCPFFTDHGENHIHSVIQTASSLLTRHLDPNANTGLLSTLDLFLILSAILWHDVGNVYGRIQHAERIDQITQEIKKLGFPTPDIHRLVVEISKAHAGETGLDIPRREEDCATSHRTYTVSPKALAALVRFADEISENRSRISAALRPRVPDDNRIFWEYANCISASRPEPARERVVVTFALQSDMATRKFSCPDFPDRVNGRRNISLVEYVLCRLEKMNNERAYCGPEFATYAYIRYITARFSILRATERLETYDLEVVFGDSGLHHASYPTIEIFDGFFESYPNWKPENLRKSLRK